MRLIVFIGMIVASGLISCQKEGQLDTQMEETLYLRSGGNDMPAFVRGNGESKVFILVLHGGPGGNGLEYRSGSYAEQLEEKYAMVYWDQRHQGNSQGHLTDEEVTLDAMVDDTYHMIRLLKTHYGEDISVFLFGHSWGGTLGTAFMLKNNYQDEVAGWIEANGAHDIPMLNVELVKMIQVIGGEEIEKGNNVQDWQEMVDFANSLDTNNIAFEDGSTLNGYAHRIEGLLDQIKTSEDEPVSIMQYLFFSPSNPMTSGMTGLQLPDSFQREVEETALTDRLNEINRPTLLLWGKYDFVVPPALGYSAYERIGTSEKYLKIYEHSAHSPMNNEPDLFVQDIVEFVELYR